MKTTASALLLFVLCSFAAGQVLPAYNDPEAYEVYSAAIANERSLRASKAKSFVIRAETGDWPGSVTDKTRCLSPTTDTAPAAASAIVDYHQKNENPWLLQAKLRLPFEYSLSRGPFVDRIITQMASEKDWKDLFAKYPGSGGVIILSAVGFDADKTVAALYVGYYCEGNCGSGTYRILEKKDGKWSPAPLRGSRCSWIS